jgi:hypothetical protein
LRWSSEELLSTLPRAFGSGEPLTTSEQGAKSEEMTNRQLRSHASRFMVTLPKERSHSPRNSAKDIQTLKIPAFATPDSGEAYGAVSSGSLWYSPSPSTPNTHCRQTPKSLLTAALRKSSSGRLSPCESERLKSRRTRTDPVFDYYNSNSKQAPTPTPLDSEEPARDEVKTRQSRQPL